MDLPVGYRQFHKEPFFNYQLNRLHALGYARQSDIEQAARQIKDRDTYVTVFLALANQAEAAGRLKNQAFYLRAAEFFAEQGSPTRNQIYRQFVAAFDTAFADEGIVRHQVNYNGNFLPALELAPQGMLNKGTVLVFGGFDSLIEEFYVIWRFFATAGYRVIAFEGPGQGGALHLYGNLFDHDWEKPVAAMLDHFAITEAALIGISMGGYWALRAAAFEPRIKWVVSWPPVYDWLEQIPPFAQTIVKSLVQRERFMDAFVRIRMRLFPILNHAIRQALAMSNKQQPIDAIHWILAMNATHLNSQRITQDVLLIGGEHDRFQPVKLLHKQRAALINARSVSTRIFTKAENADMHCQMGNLNLVLQEITAWLNNTIPAPATG